VRSPFTTLLVGLLAVTTPALAAPATPTPQAEKDARVAELQAEMARLRQEMARLAVELERLRKETLGAAEAGNGAEAGARLAALEAQQARLAQELHKLGDELKQATDALDALSEGERRRPTLTVYGSLLGYQYEGQTSRFDAEAFELVLSGRPHKRLSFFAEIEFEQAASVGESRGGNIKLEQAYASLTFTQLASFRAGVLLVPFGNVNVDHYAPLRDTISKPIVSYAVAPSDWTDNGVALTGRHLIGTSWLFDYEACVVAGLGAQIDALGTREARQPFGQDNNDDKAVVGRISISKTGRLDLGFSGYTGKYDDGNRHRLSGWAGDGLLRLGPVKLTGEYDRFFGDTDLDRDMLLHGYYVRAVYEFAGPAIHFLGKDFDDPKGGLVFQYDDTTVEAPLDGVFVRNREKRYTAGFNFRPSRQWVLKLDREWNQATNLPLMNGSHDAWLGAIGFVF
jgi:hypothetical protein